MIRAAAIFARLALAAAAASHALGGSTPRVSSVTPGPGVIAIRCGVLIDGRANAPLRDVVLVLEGDRVRAVDREGRFPAGVTRTIDLSGSTVLPGLIDAHAHPLIATDDYQVDHLRLSSAAKALRGLAVVQEMLDAGWTTIRIPGDADVHDAHLDLRDAIHGGLFRGPRISAAGH